MAPVFDAAHAALATQIAALNTNQPQWNLRLFFEMLRAGSCALRMWKSPRSRYTINLCIYA